MREGVSKIAKVMLSMGFVNFGRFCLGWLVLARLGGFAGGRGQFRASGTGSGLVGDVGGRLHGLRGGIILVNLYKGFTRLDHAQFMSRALLDGLRAFPQIPDIGGHGGIPDAPPLALLLQFLDTGID